MIQQKSPALWHLGDMCVFKKKNSACKDRRLLVDIRKKEHQPLAARWRYRVVYGCMVVPFPINLYRVVARLTIPTWYIDGGIIQPKRQATIDHAVGRICCNLLFVVGAGFCFKDTGGFCR